MFIPVDADLDIWSIWAFSIEWFPDLDVIDHGFVRVQAGQIRNLTLVSINFVGHRCSCTCVFFFEFTEPWNKSFAMTQCLCFATTWKWPAGIFKSKKNAAFLIHPELLYFLKICLICTYFHRYWTTVTSIISN